MRDRAQNLVYVDAAVLRGEGRKPPRRLLELPLTTDAVPALGLIPRNSDVHQPLVEILLRSVGRAPGVLERLVGGEELSAADQVEALSEAVRDRVRRRP